MMQRKAATAERQAEQKRALERAFAAGRGLEGAAAALGVKPETVRLIARRFKVPLPVEGARAAGARRAAEFEPGLRAAAAAGLDREAAAARLGLEPAEVDRIARRLGGGLRFRRRKGAAGDGGRGGREAVRAREGDLKRAITAQKKRVEKIKGRPAPTRAEADALVAAWLAGNAPTVLPVRACAAINGNDGFAGRGPRA